MCKPLSEGGKRCAAHMHGTRAAIKEAEVYSRQDKGVLRQVFNFLRREGKNSETPSREEVQAYADGQRIRARFDPELSNRERNMLINNWQRAREEEPDGGTFHAWKNLRSEALRRMRRGVAGLTLIGTVAVTGACGSPTPPNVEEPPVTPSISPTEEQKEENEFQLPDNVSFELPDGFITKDPVTTAEGTYQPIALGEDSPLRIYDESTADDAAKRNHSPEEIEDAQNVVVEFIVNEGIDTPLTFDYSPQASQEWWERNVDIIHPASQGDFWTAIVNQSERSSLMDTNAGSAPIREDGSIGEGTWLRGRPIYDGGIRKGDLSVELQGITGFDDAKDYIRFEYDVSYKHIVVDPREEEPKPLVEENNHNFIFLLGKYGGDWKLYGANNHISSNVPDTP